MGDQLRAWRSVAGVIGVVIALLLAAGCGGGSEDDALVGMYQSTSDPEDRIELLRGGKARVVAIVGQGIDVWEHGTARTGIGRELQEARRANRTVETVDATYKVLSPGTLQIQAPNRGSRILQFNAEAGTLRSTGRNYLSRS